MTVQVKVIVGLAFDQGIWLDSVIWRRFKSSFPGEETAGSLLHSSPFGSATIPYCFQALLFGRHYSTLMLVSAWQHAPLRAMPTPGKASRYVRNRVRVQYR